MLPYNALKICRICLLEESNMILLSSETNSNNVSPIDILKSTIKLEFPQCQDLPNKICMKCFSTVRNYHAFVQHCHTSEEILQSYSRNTVAEEQNTDNSNLVVDTEKTSATLTEKKELQNSDVEKVLSDIEMMSSDDDCFIIETKAEVIDIDESDKCDLDADVISLTDSLEGSEKSDYFFSDPIVNLIKFEDTNVIPTSESFQFSSPYVLDNNDINLKTKMKRAARHRTKTHNNHIQYIEPQFAKWQNNEIEIPSTDYREMVKNHWICCKCKTWKRINSFDNHHYLVCSDCRLLPGNQIFRSIFGLFSSCVCGELFSSKRQCRRHRSKCYLSLLIK